MSSYPFSNTALLNTGEVCPADREGDRCVVCTPGGVGAGGEIFPATRLGNLLLLQFYKHNILWFMIQ